VSKQPITREKAMALGAVLFCLSVFGTAIVIRRFYFGQGLWFGMPLYAALFACAAVMGSRAKPEEIRRSLGAGVLALVRPAPRWALGLLAVELALLVLCGWPWTWRSTLPLAAGIVAGYKWARQFPEPTEPAAPEKDAPPPMDFWKP